MPKDLKIPNIIVKSKALSSDAKVILAMLLQEAEFLTPESVSISSLANTAGITEKLVVTALSQLASSGFLQLSSPVDQPEVTLAEATDLACHLDMRLELRKTPLRAQNELPLDDGDDDSNDVEIVDGEGYRYTLTDDFEEPGKVFLNVWRVDDDGHDVQQVVQGAQFESTEDAEEWWVKFKTKEDATILDWLVTLAPSDSDDAGQIYIQLTEETFDSVMKYLVSVAPNREDDEQAALDYAGSLAEFEQEGQIPMHGRIYTWDSDSPENGCSFDSEVAESDSPVDDEEAATEEATEPVEDDELASDEEYSDEGEEEEEDELESLTPEQEAFFQHPNALDAIKLLAGAKGITLLKIRNAFQLNADKTEELAKLMVAAGFLTGKAPKYTVAVSDEDIQGWVGYLESGNDEEEVVEPAATEEEPEF